MVYINQQWLVSLNKYKCKLISFTGKKSVLSYQYVIDPDQIETVSTYKYLGSKLTSDLSCNDNIEAIYAESSRTLGFIRRNLCSAPPLVRKMAYDVFVKPKLEYATSIWSLHQAYPINHLEAV